MESAFDDLAKRYYLALHSLGKKIPRDISMVSFDNRWDLKPYPVSTVDFGLELLGYQAFHLITKIMPVRTGRNRQLFGINRLMDNGSITSLIPNKT